VDSIKRKLEKQKKTQVITFLKMENIFGYLRTEFINKKER
jgi:hypothetical protein